MRHSVFMIMLVHQDAIIYVHGCCIEERTDCISCNKEINEAVLRKIKDKEPNS
jgi:hypothetical protein